MKKQSNIVPIDKKYTYEILKNNIILLKKVYPFIEVGNIGYSVLSKQIPYVRIGFGENHVFYSASIHANEWITSILLMKFIENFCEAYTNNRILLGYDLKYIFNHSSIYIAPMVNPDGVDLVTGEIDPDTPVYYLTKKIASHYPLISFPIGWKANIRGVDLNLQFPARMGAGKKHKIFTRFYFSCTT